MSKQIISTANAPAAIGIYSQAVRVGNTIWVSGQIPLDPETKELVKGDMEAQVRRVFDNLKAIVIASRRQLRRRGQGNGVPDRSVALRSGQQDHGRVLPRAVSRAGGRRGGLAAARRAGRSGVHRRPVIDALKPVTALRGVGDRSPCGLRALGVETTQDLLFLLPLRYEDRTRVVPLGELRPGQRAAVEGEVLLTEVVFRGRRQMLCRIARRLRLSDPAVFLLYGAAAERLGARRAHPLFRRGAPRPEGPGDRASGISAGRSQGAAAARRPPHADLSRAPKA